METFLQVVAAILGGAVCFGILFFLFWLLSKHSERPSRQTGITGKCPKCNSPAPMTDYTSVPTAEDVITVGYYRCTACGYEFSERI